VIIAVREKRRIIDTALLGRELSLQSGKGWKGCFDECDQDCRRAADGFSNRAGLVLFLSNAMVAATNGWICGAKNVSGLRLDYSAIKGGVPGVRASFPGDSSLRPLR
jgi:hypothetical protein